jgi:enoyl-CoA hydratase
MNYRNILLEKESPVALITINRPDKLNTLNVETLAELSDAFSSVQNDSEIKAVILTGAGNKAFAAGADITELNQLDRQSGEEFAINGQKVFDLIENFEKPVIAAVNGYALGGGCELALSCHIRLASENAKFGQPEVNLGLIPGFGGTQRLARLINSGRALEYILSGDPIDSSEALRIGLANKIYPQNELITKAKELAVKISSKGQVAIRAALRTVTGIKNLTQEQGLKLEAELFGLCCGSEDAKEGTSAFLEKRKPDFKNK